MKFDNLSQVEGKKIIFKNCVDVLGGLSYVFSSKISLGENEGYVSWDHEGGEYFVENFSLSELNDWIDHGRTDVI